jgi:hypothetical protein
MAMDWGFGPVGTLPKVALADGENGELRGTKPTFRTLSKSITAILEVL